MYIMEEMMNIGLHHLVTEIKSLERQEIEDNKPLKTFINRFIYFIGGFGVAVIIPQVTRIWFYKEADGVSLTTWGGFFIASVFWLIYGLIHKEKPIIYTNVFVCVLDLLIIVGIISHRWFGY